MKRLCGYRYAVIKGNAVTPVYVNLLGWPLLTAADDHKAPFHFEVGALCFPAAPSPRCGPKVRGYREVILGGGGREGGLSLRLSSVGCRVRNIYGQVSTAPGRI